MHIFESNNYKPRSPEVKEKIPDANLERTSSLLEKQSELFQTCLFEILEAPLTLENISEYGGALLNSLINFTNEVITYYQINNPAEAVTSGEKLENRAFEIYGIESLNGILNRIQSKIEQIENITTYIVNQSGHTSEVITPSHGLPYSAG